MIALEPELHKCSTECVIFGLIPVSSDNMAPRYFELSFVETITVGGDIEIDYKSMLSSIQHSLPIDHPARKCILVSIPSILFISLILPIFIFSPMLFESLIRIRKDLSGFKKIFSSLALFS